jgi:uncharacterized protein (TIGR02646 family)
MIRVSRIPSLEADQAIEALAKCDRNNLTERECAEWFFLGRKPRKPGLRGKPKKPIFEAYKSDLVKQALNKLFRLKCAYCESLYQHSVPMDVEHYRPKSGYLDQNGMLVKPGYYWLAADWDNLFPSCVDCNRERFQIRGKAGEQVRAKSGKGNKFPLARDSIRATKPDEHFQEKPLLLSPSDDSPENHLCFTDDGMVLPSVGPIETQLPKGETTIEVCGLDREHLVSARKAIVRRLKDAMQRVCSDMRNVRRYPGDEDFKVQLTAARQALASFAEPDEPYLAMVSALIDTFNRVCLEAEGLWFAVRELDAHPHDEARETQVRIRVRALKVLLEPSGHHSQLARCTVKWLGLDSLVVEGG